MSWRTVESDEVVAGLRDEQTKRCLECRVSAIDESDRSTHQKLDRACTPTLRGDQLACYSWSPMGSVPGLPLLHLRRTRLQ
jgi:hypothetical protein